VYLRNSVGIAFLSLLKNLIIRSKSRATAVLLIFRCRASELHAQPRFFETSRIAAHAYYFEVATELNVYMQAIPSVVRSGTALLSVPSFSRVAVNAALIRPALVLYSLLDSYG
jgi:hypothetical protein